MIVTVDDPKNKKKKKKKSLNRVSVRKQKTEEKVLEAKIERRGDPNYSSMEGKITDLMTKGRIELQWQKQFEVKKKGWSLVLGSNNKK